MTGRKTVPAGTPILEGHTLRNSGDRKVSPVMRVKRDGSNADVRVLNAFGLPAGDSCPGMTDFCRGVGTDGVTRAKRACYAKGNERYPAVSAIVRANLAALESCGDDVDQLAALLRPLISSFRAGATKHSAELLYRIHWDGDFYSVPYARAWARVIRANPDIRFWAYTRSFIPGCNVVPALKGLPNLSLYLSVDGWNRKRAAVVTRAHPWVLVAACGEDSDDTAAILSNLLRRNAPRCPENVRKIPLMVRADSSRYAVPAPGEIAQGACVACNLCPAGKADVRFQTTH